MMKISNRKTGITTSKNPSANVLVLIQDMLKIFPDSCYFKRKKFKIRQIIYYLKARNYKNLLILKDTGFLQKDLWLIDLESQLTVHFGIKSVLLKKNLGTNSIQTFHKPELILNNFQGVLATIIANFIKNLFPLRPDFKGRQVATFHFQDGFIFSRFHRYIFSKSKKDVRLQELGPRINFRFLNLYETHSKNFF
mmetsp:Transcript_69265/g.144407  ORF Transcript_69265/g.144407 Transcript_69265/m.144407 type:complete len:194 (-) Transcript_69265:2166-2747(-)